GFACGRWAPARMHYRRPLRLALFAAVPAVLLPLAGAGPFRTVQIQTKEPPLPGEQPAPKAVQPLIPVPVVPAPVRPVPVVPAPPRPAPAPALQVAPPPPRDAAPRRPVHPH